MEIDSTSVDKLASSDLPSLERQVDNFLQWISDELSDDRMGTIRLPENLDHLAGLVGVVDGERIEALVGAMQKEGLIERLSGSRVRLSMSAWDRLDRAPRHIPAINLGARVGYDSQAEAAFQLDEIIQAHCPRCGPHRNANVLRRYIDEQLEHPEFSDTLYSLDDYRILKCRGCEVIYMQKVGLLYDVIEGDEDDFNPKTGEYSERLNPITTYWPAPSRRIRPLWLSKISDQVIRSLLEEVYEALDADLRSIAAMGIRAALDKTFELAGADPAHGFAQKLAALEALDVIAAKEKELLLIMTDAGSAAAHRGWKPEPEELDSILDTTEGLLQRVALLTPAAKKIKDRVPPRPPKK